MYRVQELQQKCNVLDESNQILESKFNTTEESNKILREELVRTRVKYPFLNLLYSCNSQVTDYLHL